MVGLVLILLEIVLLFVKKSKNLSLVEMVNFNLSKEKYVMMEIEIILMDVIMIAK